MDLEMVVDKSIGT